MIRRDEVELAKAREEQLGKASAAPATHKDAATPLKQRHSSNPLPPGERDQHQQHQQQLQLQGIVSRFLRSANKLSSKMYSNGQRMINTIGGLFGGFK